MRLLIILMMSMYSSLLFAQAQNSSLPIYLDMGKPIDERIDETMNRMTLKEKVALCHAQSKFSSPEVLVGTSSNDICASAKFKLK